jgi:hypothetical protein
MYIMHRHLIVPLYTLKKYAIYARHFYGDVLIKTHSSSQLPGKEHHRELRDPGEYTFFYHESIFATPVRG